MYSADTQWHWEYFRLIFGGKIVDLIAPEYCLVSECWGDKVTAMCELCENKSSNP